MGESAGVVGILVYFVIVISACSYLREVSDADYLMTLAYLPELFADNTGCYTAYTVVYLIKDQSRYHVVRTYDILKASIILDISPPDTILARGFKLSPLLVVMKISTLSIPDSVGSESCSTEILT